MEIQAGNFAAIKSKLTHLARSYQVRLIYQMSKRNGLSGWLPMVAVKAFAAAGASSGGTGVVYSERSGGSDRY